MSREAFIRDLAQLLLRLEGGMPEFESPLPQQTKDGLLTAVVAFGDESVPILLERFTASFATISHGYIIDALKRIGNPAAVPALIAFHQHYGNYDSRAGAMSALRVLGTEQAYLYMGETLTRYALGNPRVVDSTLELVIASHALGEWGDHRAIAPLMAAAQIHHEAAGMPQAASRRWPTFRWRIPIWRRSPSSRRAPTDATKEASADQHDDQPGEKDVGGSST